MDDIYYEQNMDDFRVDLNKSDLFNGNLSNFLLHYPEPKVQEPQKVQINDEKLKKIQSVNAKQEYINHTNNKNKYVNKIKTMTPHQSTLIQNTIIKSMHSIQKSNVRSAQSEIQQNSSQKKSKNRISAKMSRERKKIYMQLLETKVQQLQSQIFKKRDELLSTRNYMQRLVQQNQTMNGFALGKQQIIKALQKLIEKDPNPNIDEVNNLLDSLRLTGQDGKNRSNTINEYFTQIVNVSFPALHKYMMWTASEKKHLFSETKQQNQQWFKQLDEKLCLSQEQKRQIRSKRDQLLQQKNILLDIINNLNIDRIQIEQKSEQIQKEIHEIRKILNPVQCAKFILFIQKNKYRKQLNIWENKNQTIISNNDNGEDKIKKKKKI